MVRSEIITNLYVGDYRDAQNLSDISFVINCTSDIPFYSRTIQSVRIPLHDTPTIEQNKILYDAIFDDVLFNRISHYLFMKQKVLIHCYAGVSRSASVAACFIMFKYYKDLFEAIAYIKKRRNIAFSNGCNFMQAMKRYYKNMG